MNSFLKFFATVFCFSLLLISCSNDNDDVRLPEDILGVWSPSSDVYLEFLEKNEIRHLQVEYQDGESIGLWTKDVYYYEPGYNLVIYLSGEREADVYQIVEMTHTHMTWCWVDAVTASNTEDIGKVIGDIIKKAQEGYKLDPALYQSFLRLTQDQFFDVLEKLDLNYPWADM